MPGYYYGGANSSYGFLRIDGGGHLVWSYLRKSDGEVIADWYTPGNLKDLGEKEYTYFQFGNGGSPTTEQGNNESH